MNILVIGGDSRQIYCAGRLALIEDVNVFTLGLDEDGSGLKQIKGGSKGSFWETSPMNIASSFPGFDAVILPYLSTKDGLIVSKRSVIPFSEIKGLIKPGTAVFAGRLTEGETGLLVELGAKVYDWFSDERLTLSNSRLTAEGAAQIIIRRSKRSLGGSKLLILGWGRLARECSELFLRIGAGVSVWARRSESLKQAEKSGCTAIPELMSALSDADIVVSTVPARILGEAELSSLKKDSWILELASSPYSFDPSLARLMGICYSIEPGIPGRFTPESAGAAMAESVISRLGLDLNSPDEGREH
ncbi:MAG TPA: hypothetical protein IAD28_02915 [Candidatus Faeciplasma avium]|uniref:D-isomer specific 2-hydroxyacid dehydrogenase NAD-binding domain-containing protein n=1 Tax=Candidatus Faeciplasma avium TaxID=2840798 RepID=A0A9D1T3V9_9FIRM|nr:hypothetical protein [Candidatus Faeciplasma avium]